MIWQSHLRTLPATSSPDALAQRQQLLARLLMQAEQATQLLSTRLAVLQLTSDAHDTAICSRHLGDCQMSVRMRRHLGQMRHAEDLARSLCAASCFCSTRQASQCDAHSAAS